MLVQYIQLYDCTELIISPLDDPVVYGPPVGEHHGGHLLHRHPVSGKDMTSHKRVHDHKKA